MLAIQTHYIGPTNYRGSRIKAAVMESKHDGNAIRTVTISYDDALNTDENHKLAATTLIMKLGWTTDNGYGNWIVGSCERGYVFVCDTKHGNDRLFQVEN